MIRRAMPTNEYLQLAAMTGIHAEQDCYPSECIRVVLGASGSWSCAPQERGEELDDLA